MFVFSEKMSYRIRNVKRVNYAELCRSLCMMDDDEEDEDYIEGETGDSSKSDDSTSSEENDLSDENVHETISNLDDDPQWVMCRKVGEQWTSKEFKVFEGELAAEMNFPDRPLMEKKNRQFAEWNSDFAVYNEQRNQWTDEVVRFIHEMEELNRARKLEIEAKTVTDPENCKAQLLYLCREMARDGVQGICTIPKHLKHDANKDVLPEVNEEESANSAKDCYRINNTCIDKCEKLNCIHVIHASIPSFFSKGYTVLDGGCGVVPMPPTQLIKMWSLLANWHQFTQCFSSMKPNLIQPTSVMRYSTQSECLQACRSGRKNDGSSILWDARTSSCYLFSTTARQHPTLLMNRYGTEYYEYNSNLCGGIFPPPSSGQLNLLFPPPSSAVIPQLQPERKSNEKCLVNYFVVAKSELDAEPDSDTEMVTEIGDENTCIAKCTKQESCQSFTTLLPDKVCILTSNQAIPTGKCRLSYYEDAVYFEKFHLCAEIANSCSEQFFYTFHDHTLDTPTILTTKTKSLEQCANDCVANNQCKAAVFDKLKKRCFLKAVTAVDQPSALTECRGSYYFENGCRSSTSRHDIRMNDSSGLAFNNKTLQLIKKQSADQWTSWSSCQFVKDGQRFRSRSRRNCTNVKLCSGRKVQYRPC
ncbi:Uncharacterized protein T4E_3724 [Trichinella pseudospiralis]|uniref:Apple domain-containing protein n=1 Tax=Trichinella pseudospiralis TaxID=6337 RepID=A0A0V0XUB1_TRIPS|nr:Uncharacterized protein T4E_3724 [Trichinella pseudospiralis]